jgi:aminoglycoside 3-N-acetyltransferase I
MRTKRLIAADREIARELFALMAAVFEEDRVRLSDGYLDRLLSRTDFWVIAAFMGDAVIGGITGHTLQMTRTESSEVFVYDIAVRAEHQRSGVGRQLMIALREGAAAAGIHDVFVLADNSDIHALDFYRGIGGFGSSVTLFEFPDHQD